MDPINGQFLSASVGTGALTIAAFIALCLTLVRGNLRSNQSQLQVIVGLTVAVLFLQAIHFLEELATGFHRRFPEMLGLSSWPLSFFITFNLALLAVWSVAAIGLNNRSVKAALWPTWFLAIACVVNGIAHPAFAVAAGGYFPGVISSPLVGIAGLFLLRRLVSETGVSRSIGS